jgi:predicted transcriptional regulator of viral defense system
MDKYEKISSWVEDLPKRGKTAFTRNEVETLFANMTKQNISNTLNRLVKKKTIQSVWRGFYAVVLDEYGLQGIIPPSAYINQLMNFLNQDYYVALLSAAALQGAAHQQPQEFYVMTNSRILRDKQKGDIKINFVTKKMIPEENIVRLTTNSGYINVSSSELTAFDLLIYEKNVGGINRVAIILNELAETISLKNISLDFLKMQNVAVIQRLGYLLDLLDFSDLADELFHKSGEAGAKFRKYPLSILSEKRNLSDFKVNEKWKIIINEDIDTDELYEIYES